MIKHKCLYRTMLFAVLTCSFLLQRAMAQNTNKDKKNTVVQTPVITSLLDSTTEGTVMVGDKSISYRAVAGILTVGSTDMQDSTLTLDGVPYSGIGTAIPNKFDDDPAVAQMFYTAYFKENVPSGSRPITFLYNGGPGSSTVFLHMGAFGPMRVALPKTEHPVGAPYDIVKNKFSLLDVSDLVFIDAPGTGFSRILGKDAGHAFWGIDEDAHAFDRFIRRFLTKFDLWNSPKYLFGESYGTTRGAVLGEILQDHNVDLNGIIELSENLNFDNSPEGPPNNPNASPGNEQNYFLVLPSMAATAWYHHYLPYQPADLESFLREVEQFSLGEYASALLQGSDFPDDRRLVLAEKLHKYTGIPVAYWIKAGLRISGAQFRKQLETDRGLTIGRLDTRYEGPDLDPLSEEAGYDPLSSATNSAFGTAINLYAHKTLKYGMDMNYKLNARGEGFKWHWSHVQPGPEHTISVNVMPDLAIAMKRNPQMKVLLLGGYFDLSGCNYFTAVYEMKHLPIPANLQQNISYHFYQAGHMVYTSESVLKDLHGNVANFIESTYVAH